jgi:hypothetical protein
MVIDSSAPAGLNFGDCFSYALAKATGEPLLFNGDGFSRTDIKTSRLNAGLSTNVPGARSAARPQPRLQRVPLRPI